MKLEKVLGHNKLTGEMVKYWNTGREGEPGLTKHFER